MKWHSVSVKTLCSDRIEDEDDAVIFDGLLTELKTLLSLTEMNANIMNLQGAYTKKLYKRRKRKKYIKTSEGTLS
jgi:hypothetical protein